MSKKHLNKWSGDGSSAHTGDSPSGTGRWVRKASGLWVPRGSHAGNGTAGVPRAPDPRDIPLESVIVCADDAIFDPYRRRITGALAVALTDGKSDVIRWWEPVESSLIRKAAVGALFIDADLADDQAVAFLVAQWSACQQCAVRWLDEDCRPAKFNLQILYDIHKLWVG